MIGTLNPQDKRATIIGAGISGLLIGYVLKKKGYQVTIHEKSNRCGGLIQTKHTSHGIVEAAAHSLLVNEIVQEFMDELGVELLPVNPDSKARYIYRKGKMRRMPLTFFELISTFFHLFRKPKLPVPLKDLNLEQWGNAYLGTSATQYLLAPFTSGIFACTPRELNTRLSFPKLLPGAPTISLFQHIRTLRRKPKSVRPRMMALKNGMEDLIQNLHLSLQNEIHLNSEITDLKSIKGNLILSVPSNTLGDLLKTNSATMIERLPEIRYSPLITATVFYAGDSFKNKAPHGVGVLIPRGEGLRMLGCLFSSSAFSGRTEMKNEVSLTVMLGGTQDPDALNLSNPEISALIEKELSILLKTKNPPTYIEITQQQRAVPIYSSELTLYIDKISRTFCSNPGKIIFSNFSGQVSIRGMIETAHHL